jgi:hypothetical protein
MSFGDSKGFTLARKEEALPLLPGGAYLHSTMHSQARVVHRQCNKVQLRAQQWNCSAVQQAPNVCRHWLCV